MRNFPVMLWSLAVLGSASAGLFLGSSMLAQSGAESFEALLQQHEHVPGSVIVKVKRGVRAVALLSQRFPVAAIKPFETNKRYFSVKLASASHTAAFLAELSSNPAVEFAEPNYIMRALGERLPNDPDFAKQWALRNEAHPGADISAANAWELSTGERGVRVAVIDTGVDYTHEDLSANIFVNEGEIAGNGIDDDANGFIDDIHGWNFASGNNDPMDDNGHGTHIAGSLGAHGNNGVGISGVNWEVSILPVKFLSKDGSGSLEGALKAIQYASMMGVTVMNNSGGGGGFSQALLDAIREANEAGALFVAAAGGDGTDSDRSPTYPAGYDVENVLSVAASSMVDGLAHFSTYGERSVDIAAPGEMIYSTVPGNKYESWSGTSFSAAYVSGAAALVASYVPALSPASLKDRLIRSRDPLPAFAQKVVAGGRLNAYQALMGIFP